MFSRLYEKFWYATQVWLKPSDRRPYTFIIRDIYHANPIAWTVLCLWVGYTVNRFSSFTLRDWLIASLALLLGHLFWGTPWKEKEQEFPEYNPDKE